jgi:hypothetical protein
MEGLVNKVSNGQFWVTCSPGVDDSSFGALVNILYDSRQLLVPSGITGGSKRFSWTGSDNSTFIGGKSHPHSHYSPSQ